MNNLLTTNIVPGESIKNSLHDALANIEPFEQGALIGYPNSGNIGDNLIWLGTKVKYASTGRNFSTSVMERNIIGKAPILIQGGGSLGDVWYEKEKFKEKIISDYQDQAIIMPQTIYLKNSDNLKKAVKVFNSHPNLTLFTRDDYSYNFASQHFDKCQLFKAPDMAFQMVNMPGFSSSSKLGDLIWYLRRKDKELDQALDSAIENPNIVTENWVSFERKWAIEDSVKDSLKQKYRWNLGINETLLIQGIAQLLREGWQRGLTTPREWISRQMWEFSCPYKAKFNSFDQPYMYYRSLSFVHSGIYQFKKYRLVITSRLHGHIFAFF